MSKVFKEAAENPNNLLNSITPYKYHEKIRTPDEMGMSGSGNAITKNIQGITGYVQVLFAGGGRASKVYGAMGKQQFVNTGALCKDIDSGENVGRSIYINNIPVEKTLIASGMNAAFGDAKGLVPGIINNISNINPFSIFGSFLAGATPDCKKIELPVKDNEGRTSRKSDYLTIVDIKSLSPCLFSNNTNPITKKKASCLDSFNNIEQDDINTDIQIINELFNKSDTNTYLKYSDIISYIYLSMLIILFISLIKNKKS